MAEVSVQCRYCNLDSDGWLNHLQLLPQSKHLIGKIFTQRIECHNLPLVLLHKPAVKGKI
jgi:IS1 family transposase